MSQTIPQSIPTFTYAAPGDTDTYGVDCTANMAARGTTIASITGCTVSRQDQQPITAADMAVSHIVVAAGGLTFSWTGVGGVAGVTYFLAFELVLTNGDTINRTVEIPVQPYVG